MALADYELRGPLGLDSLRAVAKRTDPVYGRPATEPPRKPLTGLAGGCGPFEQPAPPVYKRAVTQWAVYCAFRDCWLIRYPYFEGAYLAWGMLRNYTPEVFTREQADEAARRFGGLVVRHPCPELL